MPISDKNLTPNDVLKRYWGYDNFRPLQEDIINSVLEGKDTLGLMPTGGGKSITFQVPTMLLDGMAVVVTPIISLMKDQVDNLLSRNIKATYLHAGLTFAETKRCYEKCLYGNYKFLYVSPERLGSESFCERLKQFNVALIVVDEAHCISQWGYDFRPSFLKIASIRKIFPKVPVLALTATATEDVVDDIMDKLAFRSRNVFRKSFRRSNLSYVVRNTADKPRELIHILSSVPGSGIVYVRSRKRTKLLADELNRNGINADYYHAGLSIEEKEDKQTKWRNNEIRIIVATNAFGMGIDKPDVRIVVHVDVPNTLEEYYQEAGRAGRDGNHSYVVLLTTKRDSATLNRHVAEAYPDKTFIKRVYELAGNFLNVALGEGYNKIYDFNFNLFCNTYKLPVLAAHNALKILTQAGYVEYIEEVETKSRIKILVGKDDLYGIANVVPGEDRVLQAILRTYTGLFADYVFINEDVIAYRFGLDKETIYKSLLDLTNRHLLHYVPRKRTPYLIYTTSREEPRYVEIPKTAYEDLHERMQKRVEAVLDYAFSESGCRENKLLAYFGERSEQPCSHCDLCIANRKKSDHTPKDVQDGILYMSSVKPRKLSDFFKTLSFPKNEIVEMLAFLVDEGFVEHLPDDTYKNPIPLK